MTHIPVNRAAIHQHREHEERRRAFREELPPQDTPDGANALDEDYGQFYDATEYHEGPESAQTFSPSSEWSFEDNDAAWIHSPTHSSDEIQRDGTIIRVYDEHIEIDQGLMWDQDIERNQGLRISRHSILAKSQYAGNNDLVQYLTEQWLNANASAVNQMLKRDAQDAAFTVLKTKYFAGIIKLAQALGVTDKKQLHDLCIAGATKHHPEFLPIT